MFDLFYKLCRVDVESITYTGVLEKQNKIYYKLFSANLSYSVHSQGYNEEPGDNYSSTGLSGTSFAPGNHTYSRRFSLYTL